MPTPKPTPTPTPTPLVVPTPVSTPQPPPVLGPLPLPSAVPEVTARPDVPADLGESTAQPQPTSPFNARVPSPGAPAALTTDATSVYVGTDNGAGPASRLVVFSRTGDSSRSITISGQPATRTGGLSAAVKHGANVLVTDRSRGALLQVNPGTGQQRVLATLPDLPACLLGITGTCQPGAQDLPPSPEGLAVIGAFAYVADAGQGTIWRYDFATKQLIAWYSSSDFTTGHGPSGLARDSGGSLVFTVGETVDTAALFKGALYRLEVGVNAAGTRTLLATFDSSTVPGPVTVGRSGDVYVGLRSSGGVVVVHPNGTATALVASSRVPAPGGLSLASGVLYVADAGRPATASSGRVHSFSVSDQP
jgi:hypothetical protein